MELKVGDKVDLLVVRNLAIGFTVLVNEVFEGMLYKNELYQKIAEGEKLVGYLPVETKYMLFRASDNFPFYDEFKSHNGQPKLFVEFVEKFLNDYDSNYAIIKEWTSECHTAMINKIESENSMLDMILDDFASETKIVNNSKKFL